MIKILVVFGTRPEAIKMAPLIHELNTYPNKFDVCVCVTAQHRQMLDQVLTIFDITPDIDLDIMQAGQSLTAITTKVLASMKTVFEDVKPDLMLVHGDTTTALASAIAGFYAGIPIGHVEAGLRTHDIHSPFPEEFNRQVVTKLSRWHFAPTELSKVNLLAEGVEEESITVTGNTVIDSLRWILNRIDSDTERKNQLDIKFRSILPFDVCNNRIVLITGHRRENFGEGFIQICEALHDLATSFTDVRFVYPVHLNPNVQDPVRSILGHRPNIHLIEPLDYEPFIYLLRNCYLVLTDSGGIQEEAPNLGKPVLVMRDITERPEAVMAGTVKLVGANKDQIISGVTRLLKEESHYLNMSLAHNPYGDGDACKQIVEIIKRFK